MTIIYHRAKSIACLLFITPTVLLLTIRDCTEMWEKTDLTTYTYKIDCSNLGFVKIPDGISKSTSKL